MNALVLFALFVGTFTTFSPAQGSSQLSSEQFEALSTPWMEVLPAGGDNPMHSSYPWWFRPIQMESLKLAPEGKPRSTSKACDVKVWQKDFLNPDNFKTFHEQAASIREYTEKCQVDFESGWTGPLINMIGSLFLSFEPRNYSYGRHVMFHFQNGLKLKGYLALKDTKKKRPFVIFRSGIFSNTEEFMAERAFFFQMFEQSAFNMLIIESTTGTDYTKNNEYFSIGGFDEGLQNYIIALNLINPKQPLSQMVSSVHTMGMSMGGHGLFFGNILDQLNKVNGKGVISSSLGLCPLLNLRDTLDFHSSQGFSMSAMNYWAYSRLSDIRKRYPELREDQFIPDLLDLIQNRYKDPLIGLETGLKFPWDIKKAMIESKKNIFWELNNYWQFYNNIEVPTLIFATRQDPIVPWPINSGRIFEGRMFFEKSEVELIPFNQGYHCTLGVAYDWDKVTTLMQSHILKNSKEFELRDKKFTYPLTQEFLDHIKGGNEHIDVDFSVENGTSLLQVTVLFQKSDNPSFFLKPFRKKIQFKLPLSEFDYQITSNLDKITDRQSLVRWAYHNIETKIENDSLVFDWKIAK